jgi:hypothetical protein
MLGEQPAYSLAKGNDRKLQYPTFVEDQTQLNVFRTASARHMATPITILRYLMGHVAVLRIVGLRRCDVLKLGADKARFNAVECMLRLSELERCESHSRT